MSDMLISMIIPANVPLAEAEAMLAAHGITADHLGESSVRRGWFYGVFKRSDVGKVRGVYPKAIVETRDMRAAGIP